MSSRIRAQLPQALRNHLPMREVIETLDDGRQTSSRLQAILDGASDGNVTEEDVENMVMLLQENMEHFNRSAQERSDFDALRRRRQQLLVQRSELLQRLPTPGDEQAVPRPRRRVNDDSPQEQARRRRRREAMVLNEGDHPLGQQDIFQRRRTEDVPPRNTHP